MKPKGMYKKKWTFEIRNRIWRQWPLKCYFLISSGQLCPYILITDFSVTHVSWLDNMSLILVGKNQYFRDKILWIGTSDVFLKNKLRNICLHSE